MIDGLEHISLHNVIQSAGIDLVQRGNKHVGLCHGHPDHYDSKVDKHFQAYDSIVDGYSTRILMTVNESDPVPEAWLNRCRSFHMIFVPSTYCKEVWDKGFRMHRMNVPVRVVPHGVEDWMKPLPDRGAGG